MKSQREGQKVVSGFGLVSGFGFRFWFLVLGFSPSLPSAISTSIDRFSFRAPTPTFSHVDGRSGSVRI